ncbi:MAG TPA: hypothetical protein VK588_02485 [Chitinophagaceae bacterium]|nr:hypothetical protein [Chitinophagaceae bacterium]
MMKSKGILAAIFFSILFVGSCKQEQKKNDVFPALDFIKSQIASVDTSVYSIKKLVPVNDSTYDTTYVKREDFKTLAKDFIETPDISKALGGKYIEQRMMNNELGLVVFISTTQDESLEVRRQEVRILPDPPDDKVKSIYIEKFKSAGDSTVMKRMTWYTDKKFQIVTITQGKSGEEKTAVVEVVWNDDNN